MCLFVGRLVRYCQIVKSMERHTLCKFGAVIRRHYLTVKWFVHLRREYLIKAQMKLSKSFENDNDNDDDRRRSFSR